MIITVQPGTPIRLPLHTAFTLDVSALIPEGNMEWGMNISYFYGSNGLRELSRTTNGHITFMPIEDWNGFQLPVDAPSTEPSGRLWVYLGETPPISIDVFPSLDETQDVAALRGSAGADTLVFDAEDEDGVTPLVVDTSGGSDIASITNGAGILLGRSGNDRLTGWNHNDALYGGGGLDTLFGGGGHDRLLGMNGDDRLFGGLGDDLLTGDAGNDSLTGGLGDDTLTSGQGMDTLRGEDGNDTFVLGKAVIVPEGEGPYVGPDADPNSHTVLYGGLGDDYISTASGRGDVSRVKDGGERSVGSVDLYGGAGNDTVFVGNTRGGAVWGGDGDDIMGASVHPDSAALLALYGGNGDDNVYGGFNTDVWGGAGNDYIYVHGGSHGTAGDGDDQVYTTWNGLYEDSFLGAGIEVYGGAGNDSMSGGNAADTLHGGNDMDAINGGFGNDSLFGGLGDDSLNGETGNDWLSGGEGNDTVVGGADDLLTTEQLESGLVDMADTLLGGAGDDRLEVGRQGHILYGGSGNDNLFAADNLNAAIGVTQLFGGEGNDRLESAGETFAEGGTGNDVFFANTLNNYGGVMTVADFVRGEDTININSAVGDVQGFALDLSGNGPEAGTGLPYAVLSWTQVGTDVEVYFDENADGAADATIILANTTGLQLSDLGIIEA